MSGRDSGPVFFERERVMWQESESEVVRLQKVLAHNGLRGQKLMEKFRTAQRQDSIMKTHTALDRAMDFLTDAYGDGPELTLLLAGITDGAHLMDFITRHGCPGYVARSGRLKYQMNEQTLQQACRETSTERKNT